MGIGLSKPEIFVGLFKRFHFLIVVPTLIAELELFSVLYVYKPYLVTTKKEIREALGIPERTLDKLLKVLKANQEIFFKIKSGRNGGIQLASVKSLLLSIIKVKKEEKESYIKALTNSFDLEHTFIQETLNKLAERPKTDTQLDLFSYDTG